ncbi:MmgE/PrpD family protein [Hydrogenophaga sp. BPS33]|uniref:MmgE/PrpD family protein n=1 Tax=Hydrogenophaga sp. BPS33 TaxID=2651974 RepID=UPI00131F569E|nr:MmgE/PrpD family protein [Hydrogenophaga sp. BPS33]QHE84689.1 MmgE/PrpD family protein [Hydrogenophaga sp. BPS33]
MKSENQKHPQFAEVLANYAAGLRYEDIPEQVRERAKEVFLDTIGVALNGASSEWAGIARSARTVRAGSGESSVIGTRLKVSPTNAALLNGVAAHAFDFDDVHNESITHPAGVLVPAILAAAEDSGASGKSAIVALTAGFDVLTRVGMALEPLNHRKRGFHPTGTCGPFGAAIASGLVLGLSEKQLVWSLGVAGSCASGLMEYWQDGAMTKRLQAGLGACHGVLAASLSEAGFTGPASVFEGQSGVLGAYTDGAKPERLTANLGTIFEIENTQIKLFACRSGLHTALAIILQMIREHGFGPQEIEEITVGHMRQERMSEKAFRPNTTLDGQLSLPYSIAVACFDKAAGPSQYTPEKLHNPEILDLVQRVKPVFKQEFFDFYKRDEKALPSSVEVVLKDGRRFYERQDFPPDGPNNRRTRQEIVDKFRGLADPVISPQRAAELATAVLSLENVADLRELSAYLQA